jgi:simple sugar transport system substrate-binding protein
LKFIYITAFVDEGFFDTVKKAMNDAASLLKVGCSFTGTPGYDTDALNRMVRAAIAEKYDGIALNIINPGIFTDVISEARGAGIPVVAFNIDDPDSGRLAGVQQNFYRAGKKAGEKALPHFSENSRVLITFHDAGVSALDERARGIRDALALNNIRIETLITGNSPDLARDTILKNLSPGIAAILGTGQSDTEGAGLAAKTLNPMPYVAGFDLGAGTIELIREGVIDFAIDQQPYVQGFYPLMMLYHNKTFGVVPFDIDCGSSIIDKEILEKRIVL